MNNNYFINWLNTNEDTIKEMGHHLAIHKANITKDTDLVVFSDEIEKQQKDMLYSQVADLFNRTTGNPVSDFYDRMDEEELYQWTTKN